MEFDRFYIKGFIKSGTILACSYCLSSAAKSGESETRKAGVGVQAKPCQAVSLLWSSDERLPRVDH